MNENDKEQTAEQGGEAATKEPLPHKASFPTLEAAKGVKVPSERFKVYAVTDPSGAKVYTWGQNTELAIASAARTAGWKAEVAEPKGPGAITKERVQAKLAELSDAELAEMGLTRKKGKK